MISYLKSYDHMGLASVACEEGCTCKSVVCDDEPGHLAGVYSTPHGGLTCCIQ